MSDTDCSQIRYECLELIRRASCAHEYLMGTVGAEDTQRMILDLERRAGWYQLMTLDVEHVIEDAAERWQPHPHLRRLVEDACERIASKWENGGDTYFEARQWALDKVEEYAREDGIALVPTEDYAKTMGA